jgi:hypothetical protein
MLTFSSGLASFHSGNQKRPNWDLAAVVIQTFTTRSLGLLWLLPEQHGHVLWASPAVQLQCTLPARNALSAYRSSSEHLLGSRRKAPDGQRRPIGEPVSSRIDDRHAKMENPDAPSYAAPS